jgi:hypothetical protein
MIAAVDGFGEHTLDAFLWAIGTEIRQQLTGVHVDRRTWAS